MKSGRARSIALRLFPWLAVLWAILLVFPVQYRVTRVLIVLATLALWSVALWLWWHKRRVQIPLLALAAIVAVLVALPGRTPNAAGLRSDYRHGLGLFSHTTYVWGGENVVGIDCSGFVREGLAYGELLNGVRTLNGATIRGGISLWWHDCSALALRDGYRGLTQPIARVASLNSADTSLLRYGDLAVAADGSHVLVFVGDHTWMEADPNHGGVIKVTTPSGDHWFAVPMVLLRWTALAGDV